MYLIRKKVGHLIYYWNDLLGSWEGLENNATPVDSNRMEVLMKGYLQLWNNEDYSFIKLIGKVVPL